MATARLSVLGAGSWGTALAAMASSRADTLIWARKPQLAGAIGQAHENPQYLPGIPLPPALQATDSFSLALEHVLQAPAGCPRMIMLGIPMAGLQEVCHALAHHLPHGQGRPLHVIWTCKGISPHEHLWPHQILEQSLSAHPDLRLGVLSGPSFAHELAMGLPAAVVVAGTDPATGLLAQGVFHGTPLRIYTSQDIMGVQVGGALKNVIAIACGISDGLGLGANARAALITRGLAEIQRLGVALGGQADTLTGLAGLGDLVLTATGELSRNRKVGLALGQGRKLQEILAGGMTAEGVHCARSALELGQRHGLELPIISTVCKVLFQDMPPEQAVASLMAREPGQETAPPPA